MAEVVFDNVPEEILHAVVEYWHFKEGDHVEEGEDLVDLKSNDRTFTIAVPVTGILTDRFYNEDDEVEIGEVLAEIQEEGIEDELDIEDFDEDEDEEEAVDDDEIEEFEDEDFDEEFEEEEEEEEEDDDYDDDEEDY